MSVCLYVPCEHVWCLCVVVACGICLFGLDFIADGCWCGISVAFALTHSLTAFVFSMSQGRIAQRKRNEELKSDAAALSYLAAQAVRFF